MNNGAWGSLSTLDPILSPMLWSSVATGKRPQSHQILGFVEPKPDGSGIQPVSSTSRKARAFWNIFHHAGLRGHVVNWFASHPAEPIHGTVVTNIYAAFKTEGDQLAPLPPHTVSPESLCESIAKLRIGPRRLNPSEVRAFLSRSAKIKPKRDGEQLGKLAKMISEMASVQAAFMHLLTHEPWDYAAVYFGAIDHFCHQFIKYMPPQMPKTYPHEMLNFGEVVNQCYVYHDQMLGATLKQAGDDAILLICSDHGFLNGPQRLTQEADPAAWHRFHGIVVLHGPGIVQGEELIGATLLDIAPTLLAIMGLPVGQDMDGKVLTQAFEAPPSSTTFRVGRRSRAISANTPPTSGTRDTILRSPCGNSSNLGTSMHPLRMSKHKLKSPVGNSGSIWPLHTNSRDSWTKPRKSGTRFSPSTRMRCVLS